MTDCWLWDGAISSTGYGTIRIDGRTKLAHREAYEAAHGPIAPGLVVMHTCDVRACVNPEHLELGTHGDNARDRADKHRGGRSAKRPVGRKYW